MSALSFQRPELLLLFLPLVWLAWRTRREQHPMTTALRLLLAAVVALAAAGLYLHAGTGGRHVVFVVDRSASMPAGSEEQAIEMIQLTLDSRRPEDEVHVITFGEEAIIDRGITRASRGFQSFDAAVSPDGSNLSAALESALSLIPRGARGSIVLLSDGEADAEREVDGAVLAAAGRGVRIDVRDVGRIRVGDTSIERVELPSEVFTGEPFLITAWIQSATREARTVRLLRGEDLLESRTVELPPGRSRIRFRTGLTEAGIGTYRVELAPGADTVDRVPENDRALAATRALGARPVLVLNHDGATDPLTLALRGAGIPAVAISVDEAPRQLVTLENFRAVVLENVSAARLGLDRTELLRTWTLDHGGGLLMTGGEASFGSGGYFRSPLDDLLPVSMEQRQEHRKLAVALSITLDRSGSMAAPAEGGTKMDLANRGTVEALRLLSPSDSVSIIAVDSAAHVIQSQTELTEPDKVEAKVLGILSRGGGIFTATALKASARELQSASQVTKHVILFADASDAEEQAETPPVIALLRDMGATVSVIGLGSDTDPHAEFLRACARSGGGEAYFTASASELPRLFAMDTQAIARSTFVTDPVAVESRRDLLGLADMPELRFPQLGGYNLTYLRDGASPGAVTTDEYKAPVVAFHARGLGRVAAFTGQIGGAYGSALPNWEGFSPFFVTMVRWLSGVEAPVGVFASVERQGRRAVLSVEFDPDAARGDLGEALTASVTDSSGTHRVTLERVSPTRFEASHPLRSGEVAVTTVGLESGSGDMVALTMPPTILPYSPEYERSPDPRAGERLLRRAAARSGGVMKVGTAEILRGPRGARAWKLLTAELMLAALVLWLLEIAGRRLDVWGQIPWPKRSVKRASTRRSETEPAIPRTEPAPAAPTTPTAPTAPSSAAPKPAAGLASTLDAARRSSRDRLDRD
ncbi:von Willebrand factor type A domain protein [Planctomycetes bacterium Poly30]|uniref:von Willebrand factor type A domain protein n=1 Tax=Saltatorellus ferox TaxID=2528018 RepID=A0A518EPK0_9BACT|nr:von Willebrand factor type A domain protein [Planctomycetes bacterium Poly30]